MIDFNLTSQIYFQITNKLNFEMYPIESVLGPGTRINSGQKTLVIDRSDGFNLSTGSKQDDQQEEP